MEKARPLIATPEPTPDRQMSDSGTPWSGREGTMPVGQEAIDDLPANFYIPEEMLHFPPNSLEALAVGWNLTGGRRVYSKRQIRGREKFGGKWRHWDLDGTRDLAEMEDPDEMLAPKLTTLGNRTITDWRALRTTGEYWDLELGGPNGVPPIAFTPFPRTAPPPVRELTALEWGPYRDIETELGYILSRNTSYTEMDILSEKVRPVRPRGRPNLTGNPNVSSFANIYEDGLRTTGDWLNEMVHGDVLGEAYARSVKKFISGAMAGASTTASSVKIESDVVPLDEYVVDHWHHGVLRSESSDAMGVTVKRLQALDTGLKDGRPISRDQERLFASAKNAYARHAMHRLCRPGDPLDIRLFLQDPADFGHQGIGTKDNLPKALSWVSRELARIIRSDAPAAQINGTDHGTVNGKRKRVKDEVLPLKKVKLDSSAIDSGASSPLSEAPLSPRPIAVADVAKTNGSGPDLPPGLEGLDREEVLRRIRLELAALCKFYPLSALKKMSRQDAGLLLPQSVRALMSVPE